MMRRPRCAAAGGAAWPGDRNDHDSIMPALQAACRIIVMLGLAQGVALATQANDAAPAREPPSAAARNAAPFATVGESVISAAEYHRALSVAMRNKYYHAKPPEAELARFQREVGDDLVNRVLLLAEARRRGLAPDREKIAAALAGLEAQYKTSANWQANRDKMLAAVQPQLENDSLLERLAALVKNVAEPAEPVLLAYFEQHRDLFVEPEQVKLSVILFKVDPSSVQAVWNGAYDEAQRVHRKLLAGADFTELARLHSADRSAAEGGQVDYTHRGMLPQAVQGVVDKLRSGELAEPVQVLEGVAILRLDDRRAARQHDFAQAKQRAAHLWRRDEAQERWNRLIAELRSATPIRIDPDQYAPLPPSTQKTRAG
jgi:parvulin-like peptidyl-prolyl isomerase